MDKDIRFIARHYRKGLFAVEPALRRIKGTKGVWWTRTRIAAACTAAAILTATAAVFVHNGYFTSSGPNNVQDTEQAALPAAETVRVIDFEEAPLTQVVAKIREIYGVEVTDLPADPDQYTLSLHYEGSAIDLVETINDILDTHMKVTE